MENVTPKTGGCALCVILVIVYAYMSFEILATNEYGIDFNRVTYSLGATKGRGPHWLGFGHKFIRFPFNAVSMDFGPGGKQDGGGDLLRSRTSDGLELQVELNLQYQFEMDDVATVYQKFGLDYQAVYVRLTIDTVTREVTQWNASSFWKSRASVNKVIEQAVRKAFRDRGNCNIRLFNLKKPSLPESFAREISNTEKQVQDINQAREELGRETVKGQTLVEQARQQTQETVLRAEAQAKTIELNNQAYVDQFNLTQRLQARGFETIYNNLAQDGATQQDKEDLLLEYMRMRALRDHPSGNSIISIQKAETA